MIAGHGDSERLGLEYTTSTDSEEHLAPFVDIVGTLLPLSRFGIIFSTCGALVCSEAYEVVIEQLHQSGKWIAGYKDTVDWVPSALTEMSFLSSLVANNGVLTNLSSDRSYYSIGPGTHQRIDLVGLK